MSMLPESSNTLILLLLGLVALYFILGPSSAKKGKGKASTSNANTASDQPRQEPLIYRDDETGEYFIDEDGSGVPRAITSEELYALTGTRAEEVNAPAADPAEVVGQPEEPAWQAGPAGEAGGGGVIGPEDFEDLAQGQVDIDLERANQQLPQPGPGPATAATSHRVVGAKKAKSLERKDQHRAFFEHQRMQALADRQDAAEFDRQYGDLISAEREERREREEAAEQARRAERERAKLEEQALKVERDQVRRTVLELGEGAAMRLRTEVEREVAATVAAAAGSSSATTATPFVVDNGDWVVRFSEAELEQLGKAIKEKGSMTYEELASKLTSIKR